MSPTMPTIVHAVHISFASWALMWIARPSGFSRLEVLAGERLADDRHALRVRNGLGEIAPADCGIPRVLNDAGVTGRT
jgi:hypothetical protein